MVLALLPATVNLLSPELDISPTAVRFKLNRLMRSGKVQRFKCKASLRGRPFFRYEKHTLPACCCPARPCPLHSDPQVKG